MYAYIRTSTVKQGTEGVSLEAQRDAISAYAQRHDLHIVEWFAETQTAAKRGRPVFSQMMKSLAHRKVDGLILHRIDRGSRNLKDWSDIADLSDLGLQVHFAHDALDLATRGGRLAADVQAVVAADFIRNLRDETKKGMLGRLKQGLWPWAAPVGYRDHGRAAVKTIDPIIGPLVRQAFELYGSGQYSFGMLRGVLFERGLRTPSGKKLSLNGLTTILTNPFYYGVLRVRRWNDSFPGRHEPLISKSLFDRVQDVLHGRRRHRGLRHNHLYRRDVVCHTCTYKLLGETQKGHVYYRCHTKACPRTSLKEEWITATLEHDLALLHRFMEVYSTLASKLEQRIEAAGRERHRVIEALRLQGAQIDVRMSAASDALIEGLIDKDLYAEKRAGLVAAKASINEQIARCEAGVVVEADVAELYIELVKRLRLRTFWGNPRIARQWCQKAASNFLASGKNVELQWHPAFKELIEHSKTLRCDPERDTRRTLEYFEELLLPTLKPSENVPTSPCPRKTGRRPKHAGRSNQF